MVTPFARRSGFHWSEYLLEAAELGTFMLSACLVVALVEYRGSPLHPLLPQAWLRRLIVGIAMGLTAVGLIYSSWGQRSGAHMNPALTLTFFRLGKIGGRDAVMYMLAQFAGGGLGVLLATLLLGRVIADRDVNFVLTLPGAAGTAVAFAAEVVISALMLLMVLASSNHVRWKRYTGVFAGVFITLYITFEAPLSGMSMNPARSLGSALCAGRFEALWLYLVAPPIGMLLGAELYTRLRARGHEACAKLQHDARLHCIFCGSHATGSSFAGSGS
ncbi:MAG: aquaporin [Deltaproteobacteria bacterium]